MKPEFFYDFAKKSMEKNGYVVLPLDDITDIRNSKQPDNHIIAAKFVESTNSYLVVRGNYQTINIPTFNIPLVGLVNPPNFASFEIEDLGLTFVIDSVLSLESLTLFEGEDSTMIRDRFKKRNGGA